MALHAFVVALAIATVVAPAPPAPPSDFGGNAEGSAVELNAVTAGGVIAGSQAVDPGVRLVEYTREDVCGTGTSGLMNSDCSGYTEIPRPDCGGPEPVRPVMRRERASADAPWSLWSPALAWTCPQDALPVLSQVDFRRLPLTPSTLTTQPPGDVVFVNMPTIVFTDPTVQTFTTTLLGYPVEVEATPTRFAWDFGDGSDPIVTTSPGHPYPDQDVSWPYARAGTYTITLTTELTGRYRLGGTTTWLPVVGTATTTTTSIPITAEEHRSHLVADDCNVNPNGPWCDD